LKRENELLSQTVSKLQKELDEQMKKNSTYDSLDKKEKRAIDRRISELEEEVKVNSFNCHLF
jgi:transcription elongation GreA/GreB family factor